MPWVSDLEAKTKISPAIVNWPYLWRDRSPMSDTQATQLKWSIRAWQARARSVRLANPFSNHEAAVNVVSQLAHCLKSMEIDIFSRLDRRANA